MTRDCRSDYELHRQQVTRIVQSAVNHVRANRNAAATATHDALDQQDHPGDASTHQKRNLTLMLLGAGNCHDIDLTELSHQFSEIHLVDIDQQALMDAYERNLNIACPLILHAPLDIAWPLCCADPFATAETNTLENDSFRLHWLNQLSSHCLNADLPRCDLIVSACVLSQLVDAVSSLIGSESPWIAEAVQAIRRGHFRRLNHLCQPGGRIVFVTDFVSSDTAPQLFNVSQQNLNVSLKSLLDTGNFFTGCHPDRAARDMQMVVTEKTESNNAECQRAAAPNVGVVPPWIWTMGPRKFACYAITADPQPSETM